MELVLQHIDVIVDIVHSVGDDAFVATLYFLLSWVTEYCSCVLWKGSSLLHPIAWGLSTFHVYYTVFNTLAIMITIFDIKYDHVTCDNSGHVTAVGLKSQNGKLEVCMLYASTVTFYLFN